MGWYRKPTSPVWERICEIHPSEWRQIENVDAEGLYITGMDALNLPTGPLGDWHASLWRPVTTGTVQSTRSERNDRLCRLGTRLWGRADLVDARPALRAIGHPQGMEQTPVWAASQSRAVAEMVVDSLVRNGNIIGPDHYSAERWLSANQRETCARMLNDAKPALSNEDEKRRLGEWATALRIETALRRAQG